MWISHGTQPLALFLHALDHHMEFTIQVIGHQVIKLNIFPIICHYEILCSSVGFGNFSLHNDAEKSHYSGMVLIKIPVPIPPNILTPAFTTQSHSAATNQPELTSWNVPRATFLKKKKKFCLPMKYYCLRPAPISITAAQITVLWISRWLTRNRNKKEKVIHWEWVRDWDNTEIEKQQKKEHSLGMVMKGWLTTMWLPH